MRFGERHYGGDRHMSTAATITHPSPGPTF